MTELTPLGAITGLLAARARGDLEAAVAHYDPDATLVMEPDKIGRGVEAVRGFTQATMSLPITFGEHHVVEAGDTALHMAAWTLRPIGGAEFTGRTADVLRRQADGRWLIILDNPWGSSLLPPVGAEANMAAVLEAFDLLFNKRDYAAAETRWSPNYIQHSAHIGPGVKGLFDLVRSLPSTLRYEHSLIMAHDNMVMVHGRFSGNGGQAALIAVDIVRMENGLLAEHWDVLQDEATEAGSASGRPMFGDRFPEAPVPPSGSE